MVKYLLVGLILLGAAADVDAGAWTLQSGQFWSKLTYFQQQTEEWYVGKGRFGTPGTRTRYDFDGQYESRAVFFEGHVRRHRPPRPRPAGSLFRPILCQCRIRLSPARIPA